MKRNKVISIRKALGGMDRDSELTRIAPENYRYANNLDGGYGVLINGKIVHYGTTEIPYTFPIGDFECIGAVENKTDSSVIYFIADITVGKEHEFDMILEYRNGMIYELLKGEFLNFSPDNRVHSVTFIDGNMYWTDAVDLEGIPEGNPVRCINLDRCRPGKVIDYELTFNEDAYQLNAQYSYELTDLDGNNISGPAVFSTIASGAGPPYDGQMLQLFNDLTTAGFDVEPFPVNTADNPAKVIKFSWPVADVRVIITVTAPLGSPEVILAEMNFYPPPGSTSDFAEQITLIKPCPQFPIEPEYERNVSISRSNVWGQSFKFRYRYWFVDGEKSAWGPYSIVPTNYDGTAGEEATNEDAFNQIRLYFSDGDKYIRSWRYLVRKVEVGVLVSSTSLLTTIEVYDLNQFYSNDFSLIFTNSRLFATVPSDENADADVQALKNYDFVPKLALGLTSVYNKTGDTVVVLSGLLKDYTIINEVVGNPFALTNTLSVPFDNPQSSNNKGLKHGGLYKVALLFKDAWGRLFSTQPIGEVTVPFSWFTGATTPNLTWDQYYLRTDFVSPIPSDATAYQVAITKNLTQSTYYQFLTGYVEGFANIYDEATIAPVGANAAGGGAPDTEDATHIGFAINLEEESTSGVTLFRRTGNTNFFLPENNDRLQILYWEGGPFGSTVLPGITPDPVNVESYNYEIAGYLIYNEQLFVLIEFDHDVIPWFHFYVDSNRVYFSIEIYTPNKAPIDDIYYEFGDVQPIIAGPITVRLVDHINRGDTFITGFDQTTPIVENRNGVDPAVDATLGTEDRVFKGSERPSLHPFDTNELGDLGRVVNYDPDYQERYLPNTLRFSDVTLLDTTIRGASAFRGTNIFQLVDIWGPIRKLVYNQNVLLAIMSAKTQPIYVAKDRLMDLQGSSFVGRTDQLFNIADELMLDMGAYFPESVVYEQGQTFGFDVPTGRIWRYTSGGGQVPISDRGFILSAQAMASSINQNSLRGIHIIGGYRRRTESFYVRRTNNSSVHFKNKENSWPSFNDITYEAMVSLDLDTYVFKDGALWIIDQAADAANYFGVQYEASIDLIFSDDPEIIKVFDAIEIYSNSRWYSPSILIPSNQNYGQMQSQLPDNRFTFYESRGKADFLRDGADPSHQFAIIVDPALREATALLQGRHLRGDVLLVKLMPTNAGEYAILKSVIIFSQVSEIIIKT